MGRLLRALHRLAVAVALSVAAVSLAAALTPLPVELRGPLSPVTARETVRVLDREGRLLREVGAGGGERSASVTRSTLGETMVRALIAAEDRRFFGHVGVDPVAVVRSAALDVARGRVVSGASTLSMQLARIVRPHPRTLLGKIGEALLALRIEASLDKDRIVTEYANRAPFGPGVRGVRAASLAYFDKEPAALSVAEAALLASLPRGPSAYDPARHAARLHARRDVVLGRLRDFGLIDAEAARTALAEPPDTRVMARPGASAFHVATAVARGDFGPLSGPVIATTIDRELQANVEAAVAAQVRALGGRHVTAGAAIIVDHVTGEVLAYVGAPDPFDVRAGGFNDGVRARRQAGSTLKPFLYALAFDRGVIDPATPLADVPLTVPLAGGAFVPHDYDGQFHGPVRARVALASSLNVPAVALVAEVGEASFLDVLHAAGFALPDRPEHYGAALALGDGEVTLLELAAAYAGLARGGRGAALHVLRGDADPTERGARIVSPRAAALVADILADKEARLPAFGERSVLELPFPASVKTGTSKGYRDNWAVGFTDRVTAAVWVGNFDGSAMNDVSGVTGAGPILHAALVAADARVRPVGAAAERAPDEALASEGLVPTWVCPLSGERPGPDCPHAVREWLAPGARAGADHTCKMHVHAFVDEAGARAAPSCAARRAVFERLPPAFCEWAARAGRPVLPMSASSTCPPTEAAPASTEGDVVIEHPARDARYYLEPSRSASLQTIDVRVRAPSAAASVALRVDGREVARARPGSSLAWVPTPGRHALVAEAAGVASDAVYVEVD